MRIMNKQTVERIFVAGHRGMVGSALVRALRERGDCQLILRSRDELDLSDAAHELIRREEARHPAPPCGCLQNFAHRFIDSPDRPG